MEGVLAGLTAWGVELAIAVAILLVLKHEENKVYKRRKNNK
jgi:hypothetical protein|tara:strand:- start:653 stop:775 length:123 start_codon:yes stop_codon:yes gene_type:complete